MDKLLLRPAEAADMLGLSKSKIYDLIARETIPSIRIGKSVRVPTEALKSWVHQQMPITTKEGTTASIR